MKGWKKYVKQLDACLTANASHRDVKYSHTLAIGAHRSGCRNRSGL